MIEEINKERKKERKIKIMNSTKTEITVLNDYLKQSSVNIKSVRVIQDAGEFEYIIKFPQFNDFETTITIQVPGK